MSLTYNAAGLLVHYRDKFLLCKRSFFGTNLDGLWAVPSGSQEGGEVLLETVSREFYEETSIFLRPTEMGRMLLSEPCEGREGTYSLYYYRSPVLLRPILDLEHEGYAYFTPAEIPLRTTRAVKNAIMGLT